MTFSEMKQAKKILLDNGYTTAADIVPTLNDTDLQAILAGDFSALDQPKRDLSEGKAATDHQTKHQAKRITPATDQRPDGITETRSENIQTDQQENNAQTITEGHGERSTGSADGRDLQGNTDGDIFEDDMTGGGLLPVSLYDDIKDMISLYCKEFNIQDQQKIHPSQWKGICIRLGQSFKARRLLQDKTRISEGGFRYDGDKVAAMLALYEVVCSDFKQVPFAYNFILFSGVSRNYFADYENRLTSGRVNIKQKAYEIQRAGLTDAITAGGSATVGNIFLGKALAGLQETTTVMHVSASPAISSTELPALPSKS